MKTQMNNDNRMLNSIVLEDDPLSLESTQQAAGEELKDFQNNARSCDAVRVKPLAPLTARVAVREMKVNSCKDALRIEIWNVRSTNRDKLEIVKNEMECINIDLLEISKRKWTSIGRFESNEHIVYCAGNEKHKKNGVALIIKKKIGRAVMKYNAVSGSLISIRLRRPSVNVTIIQEYASTTDTGQ